MLQLRELPYEVETEPYRELFPHCRRGTVYLDHAATGPLPGPVVDAVQRYLARRQAGQTDLEWELECARQLKERLARLIGASSSETIALMPNTTAGLLTVALSLPWKPGDVVVVGAQEFPANVYPWRALQRFGVQLRLVPMPDGALPPERLLAVLDERVRVVALSAVYFLSGYRVDLLTLGRICRERGILLVVDGMQAVGALCLRVEEAGIAALACGGAKWLLAPHGTGFLYVAPELLERLTPALLGWTAAQDPWDFFAFDQPLAQSARRFEWGSLNVGGIVGLWAAVELLMEYGPERAEKRVCTLSGLLQERLAELVPALPLLTPAEPSRRAGIVTVRLPTRQLAIRLVAELAQRQICCSARLEYVRFSPHWYNTAQEIDRAVEAVATLVASWEMQTHGAPQ